MNKDTPMFTVIKARKKAVEAQKLDDILNNFRARLPFMIEFLSVDAQLTKAKYNSLIKEGFTEKQALELCKKDIL